MLITIADKNDIPALAKLFDQYRTFYEQKSDINKSVEFLSSRLEKNDAIIFVACENTEIVGFTQLYLSFSSVGMKQIWILNDLFVSPQFRRQSIARNLMQEALNHAKKTEALRIELATQVSNTLAQNLYESMGYIKNESFYHYSLLV
jgi:ribosomal protein S18 acetylase RimI-like enzyme